MLKRWRSPLCEVLAVALLTSLASGCGRGGAVERCESMEPSAERDACIAEVAVEAVREDEERGVALVLSVGDLDLKDNLLFRLTREVDSTTTRWCDLMEGSRFRERCVATVNRPHIRRGR